jgi:hypothetical protein
LSGNFAPAHYTGLPKEACKGCCGAEFSSGAGNPLQANENLLKKLCSTWAEQSDAAGKETSGDSVSFTATQTTMTGNSNHQRVLIDIMAPFRCLCSAFFSSLLSKQNY